MRKIYFLLITLFSLLTLSACECNTKYVYDMRVVDQVKFNYDDTSGEITYTLHKDVDPATVKVSATTNATWITSTDSSNDGVIKLTFEENSDNKSRTATVTLTATSHVTKKIKVVQYGIPPKEVNHTLMFVFMGTSLNRFFNTNLEDVEKAINTGILGDSNRILFFRQDTPQRGHISELCYDPTTKSCNERRVEDNITLPSTQLTPDILASYINTMIAEAPAQRYGIVLAGHGTAWVTRDAIREEKGASTFSTSTSGVWKPAIGAEVTRAYGEEPNVHLNISELADAIDQLDAKIDYILFDACFMSNIETIYDLRNSANYIIASPCEIMGRGFPYERTLPYLFTDDGMATDYIKAAESYYKFYRDEYVSSSRSGSIAVIDCHEVAALADATKGVLESMSKDFYSRSSLQSYEGQNPHHFFDFGEWVNFVATDSEALERFNTQLAKTVIAKYTLETFYSAYGSYGTHDINLDIYSGVTTSAPTEAYIYSHMCTTDWYQYVWPRNAKEIVE